MKQNWLEKAPEEILKKIGELPESFAGFKKELLERGDVVGDLQILSIEELGWTDHFGFAVFKVKSMTTGEIYNQEYVSRRGGKFHSLRGIILLSSGGKITHFVVRKCQRFGIAEEVYESIGNIYQTPEEMRKDKIKMSVYLEDEVKRLLHLPTMEVDQFYDLGNVYTDVSMFSNIVRIFALKIKVNDIESISKYNENKVFDDKGYSYKIEIIPISKFYEFFGTVADSFLLAIFGRLQALSVIDFK